MEKETILRVLSKWNFWGEGLETGIPRKNHVALVRSHLSSADMIATIIGVRRAGKSFILRQVARDLISTGVPPVNILYVNFEAREFSNPTLELLDRIEETYKEHLNPQGQRYVLLDEIHLIEGWERWVRSQQELGKCRMVVTGSNSQLLGGELATKLTGRHLDIMVHPLGFREFLSFKGMDIRNLLDYVRDTAAVGRHFREYMETGGFPAVVLSAGKTEILEAYYEDIINRDIIARYGPKEIRGLRRLADFYMTNISNPVTFNSLESVTGLAMNTVDKYSRYLENAMLVFLVGRYSYSSRERNKSPRKVYSIDPGLSNAVGFRFSENLGKLAENIVALELMRRISGKPQSGIYYWRENGGPEVDFVVKEGLQVRELIQVCWDVSKEDTRKREVRAILKAMEALRLDRGTILNEEYEGEEKIGSNVIAFKQIAKWLLHIE